MSGHRTAGQLRALRELCALARTGLDVCDLLAARGEEHDDRPRSYLLALERWTLGEETGPQLAARTRAMDVWRGDAGSTFGAALHWLADARKDMMRNPGHWHHSGRVLAHMIVAAQRVTGDDAVASRERVGAMLDRHRRAVGEEWAQAMAAARRRRAKADKTEAERALGTLPGAEKGR